ncbi:MAG: helix-turn-helix domain-containing protein [Planctomycetota bacterium]
MSADETGFHSIPASSYCCAARENTPRRALDPSARITEVAMECGYESLSQFYAMFGRIMGVPPGRYQRRLRD